MLCHDFRGFCSWSLCPFLLGLYSGALHHGEYVLDPDHLMVGRK